MKQEAWCAKNVNRARPCIVSWTGNTVFFTAGPCAQRGNDAFMKTKDQGGIRHAIADFGSEAGDGRMPGEERFMASESRAGWMKGGKFGMMVHWLAPGPEPQHGPRVTDLDRAVDAFDVDRFLSDFRRTRADWLIFTIGQNTGYYASPNSVLDALAGPGHCPRRDLVLEIAMRVIFSLASSLSTIINTSPSVSLSIAFFASTTGWGQESPVALT